MGRKHKTARYTAKSSVLKALYFISQAEKCLLKEERGHHLPDLSYSKTVPTPNSLNGNRCEGEQKQMDQEGSRGNELISSFPGPRNLLQVQVRATQLIQRKKKKGCPSEESNGQNLLKPKSSKVLEYKQDEARFGQPNP